MIMLMSMVVRVVMIMVVIMIIAGRLHQALKQFK